MKKCHRPTSQSSHRGGFTIVEFLVVAAIVVTLVGIVLPAIQRTRESARRIQCTNNLRQVGLALDMYHQTHGALPPGWLSERTRHSAFGWAGRLLPYLDQSGLYARLDFDVRVNSSRNELARGTVVQPFCCPSDLMDSTFELLREPSSTGAAQNPSSVAKLPSANYVGVFGNTDPDAVIARTGNGAFIGERSVRLNEFERGLSTTMIVGERTAKKLPTTWLGFVHCGEDAPARVVGGAMIRPNYEEGDECDFDSRHPGVSNFLWGDGRVQSLASNVDSEHYRTLAVRSITTK